MARMARRTAWLHHAAAVRGSKDSCPSLTAAVRTLRLLGLFAHSYFLLPYFGIKYDFFREVTGTFE